MSSRFGQLSYTSVDDAGNGGGWQVKQTSGGITGDEARFLVSCIQVALDPVEQLPPYPTQAQLRAAPRRLAYRRVSDTIAAYFHTAPAGSDATGRPGNVFAHVLLDRDAMQPGPSRRPIELWRSPGWLTPYGGAAVAGAMLPAEAPAAGDVVSPETVAGFACDADIWRLGTLCGLLDAAVATLDGAPAVVLAVDSCDTAAQWIATVSFLMSPGTARRMNFCIADRTFDLSYLLAAGHHLVTMPRTELTGVPAGVLVIDEAEAMYLGEMNGPDHRTADGQRIQATAWSSMAQVALVDSVSALQVLADIETFSLRIGDAGLPPALPMAIAVLNRLQWEDAAPEARSVVEDHITQVDSLDHLGAHLADDEMHRLTSSLENQEGH